MVGNFHLGGSEQQVVEAARLLEETGRFEVSLACLDRSGPLLDTIRRYGLPDPVEFPIDSFFRARTLLQALRFARHLRRDRIEVVHCHDFYSNVFGLFAAAIARTRLRVGARRNTGHTRSSSRAQRFVERVTFRLAHAVVTNGQAVADDLVREGFPADTVVVIPNAVDLERFSTNSCRDLPDSIGPPSPASSWVTSVANMRHPVKDHETLIRAAEIVVRSRPEAVFILAGEGELLEQYRALARELGLESSVRFPGRVEAVESLLHASRLCVLSSRAEGMSNALLEYQAAGRPVVATDVGAAREVVVDGETGIIVPPGEPDELADAIIELLDDSERAEAMGRAGAARAARLFSPRSLRDRLVSLYEEALHADET